MEHKTFGQIVPALRKEQIDFASEHSWSQHRLADETGVTVQIVGKIERGEQARLDREILEGLAQAFQLISFERREFFAMASEVTDMALVRVALSSEEVFTQVWSLLDTLCVPAFLKGSRRRNHRGQPRFARYVAASDCRDPEAYSQERIVAAAWGWARVTTDLPAMRCLRRVVMGGVYGVGAVRSQLQSKP